MPDPTQVADSWWLVEVVLATGAIGTAAFGVVDALKGTPLGLVGFHRISGTLGQSIMKAVDVAYGSGSRVLLQGFYRQDREKGALGRALRQGVRVGLRAATAEDLAREVGTVVDPAKLKIAVEKLEEGRDLDPEDQGVIGRFELAVDTRIDAALALAQASYTAWMRIAASGVALTLATVGTRAAMGEDFRWTIAILLGVAAVPLAPIAKDVASGLTSARRAARGVSRGRV